MHLPQLSESQFKIFLLIYAAHIDYVYSEEEAYLINALASGSEYKDMLTLFESQTDYQSLKIILAYREQYFQDSADRKKLYQVITELFKVDGDYSRPEKTFLEFLDKLIDTEAYGSPS